MATRSVWQAHYNPQDIFSASRIYHVLLLLIQHSFNSFAFLEVSSILIAINKETSKLLSTQLSENITPKDNSNI
jgi:hypothetical protein